MKVTGIVPARFLTIISHLVLVIVIFWSRRPNIESCLPRTYTQAEYDKKDLEMIIGLSVALGLFAIELVGFFGGLTMFTSLQCLLSISAHSGASVALSYYIWREWPCERFWYIFAFCNATPAFTELLTMGIILCCGHTSL
ncbi:transmembrane protein 107-like isoform X1 [Ruditapes philippinarum]|uniref:transmembrane protein 107-like isoform X1 n=1 Tax=Ruditapes philippinarum TaxID=129788 RepID=UPI00295ADD5F|nr:transmembrane protein 107-like isoform X1 [Ruditapes philippinarum]XP_060578748.1 transmembrane protein 107-like isoform X1 [Ruditapes philippinarum]